MFNKIKIRRIKKLKFQQFVIYFFKSALYYINCIHEDIILYENTVLLYNNQQIFFQ